MKREYFVDHSVWLNFTGPANYRRYSESTFPGCALLAVKWCRVAVGPRHGFRTIVRSENDDRVVRDSKVIQLLQNFADIVVEFLHHDILKSPAIAEKRLILRL